MVWVFYFFLSFGVFGHHNTVVILFPLFVHCSQYNLSSPNSGDVPKSHSLERKQQEPIVLTKWRHSTYALDLSDKVHQL